MNEREQQGVWATLPRATWAQIEADEDTWTDRIDDVGVVIVVDEGGREINMLAASWWLHRGLAAIAPMPMLREAVEHAFPAAWEAEQRARDTRFAEWTG